MESISFAKRQRILRLLEQITHAIGDLRTWNQGIRSAEDYYKSPSGMRDLAASCMVIEAIGEGVHQIDKLSEGKLLHATCPEIPWEDIIGIRNHIAHGYFDIDGEIVFYTIKHELDDLLKAIETIQQHVEDTSNT